MPPSLHAHRLRDHCVASENHGYIMKEWASKPLPKQPANPLRSARPRERRWAGSQGSIEFGGNRAGEETPLPRLPFNNELHPTTLQYPASLVNHGNIPPNSQGREPAMHAMVKHGEAQGGKVDAFPFQPWPSSWDV